MRSVNVALDGKTFPLEVSVPIHNLVFPISPEMILLFNYSVYFSQCRRQVDVTLDYIVKGGRES